MVIPERFDYTPLDTEIAQQGQTAAQRIRRMVQQTLQNLLAVGQELLAVKKTLPHGQFGPWLRSEFGWTERTARNFMAVAERFGAKTEMISDLRIDPTAAYLLAAPSTPEEAPAAALRRAENGERIPLAVAREILYQMRKKPVRHEANQPALPASKLLGQLLESLESFRQRWNPRQISLLAQQLQELADSLEKDVSGGRFQRFDAGLRRVLPSRPMIVVNEAATPSIFAPRPSRIIRQRSSAP